jgi:hypothetical protein
MAGSGGSPGCMGPAIAGAMCPQDGLSCGDACGNSCKCADGQWFCAGTCNNECGPGAKCDGNTGCSYNEGNCTVSCQCGPGGNYICEKGCVVDQCTQGAQCQPGTACSNGGPDGCSTNCFCTDSGTYQCKSNCPGECTQGAMCQPGTSCATGDSNGCINECFCSNKGGYECKTTCPGACTDDLVPCGLPCGQPGADCFCSDNGQPVPCTCGFGPNDAPAWQCETSPNVCAPGAMCNPGEGCGTIGPDGCSLSCQCSPFGTYECVSSCGQTCPNQPPACGTPCQGFAEGQECKCFSGKENVPCTCSSFGFVPSWDCSSQPGGCQQGAPCMGGSCITQTPDGCSVSCQCNFNGTFDCKIDCSTDTCAPGAQCAPGTACQVPQGDPGCFLSCSCSQGGLYQCAAFCDPDNQCPSSFPVPGSACVKPGLQCDYDSGFCTCGDQGTWFCAAF